MDIAKIDPNFAVNANVDLEDIIWLDGAQEPFVLYGAVSASPYLRLPLEVAKTVSEGVYELASHTAGVRLRFRTDSPYIAIHCEWKQEFLMNNMTMNISYNFKALYDYALSINCDAALGEEMSRTREVCSQLNFSESVKICVRAHDVIVSTELTKKEPLLRFFLNGRDDTIRTCDPLVPSEVRYQTALHPDIQLSTCS